jgi:hypothetical protein
MRTGALVVMIALAASTARAAVLLELSRNIE